MWVKFLVCRTGDKKSEGLVEASIIFGLAVGQGLGYNYLRVTVICEGIRKVTEELVIGIVMGYRRLGVQKNKPFTR